MIRHPQQLYIYHVTISYMYMCQSWQTTFMIKNIVVFEGDTPITQSTKVMLAATGMCIIYCGHFSKTTLIQGSLQSKEDHL